MLCAGGRGYLGVGVGQLVVGPVVGVPLPALVPGAVAGALMAGGTGRLLLGAALRSVVRLFSRQQTALAAGRGRAGGVYAARRRSCRSFPRAVRHAVSMEGA